MGGTKRVLVVDDSRMVLAVAKSVLRAAGYDVIVAANLAEMEQHHGVPIDLALVDVQMPDLRGDAMAGVLRRTFGIVAPIYLLSSLDAETLAERAANPGIDGFIEKDAGLLSVVARV